MGSRAKDILETKQNLEESLQQDQKPTISNFDAQGSLALNIKDHLDRTEMKIKDAQIKRLQDKVK